MNPIIDIITLLETTKHTDDFYDRVLPEATILLINLNTINMTHIEFKTIHGDAWIMHKDNVKNVSLVKTPEAFKEQWNKEKVVIVTSTEINTEDGKPWQFMVSNSYSSIKNALCANSVNSNNLAKTI